MKDRAKYAANNIFMYFENEKITYSEINERANKCAVFFKDLGVDFNDRVAIMLSNCPEYIYCWFGLSKLGAFEVAVNNQNKRESLLHQIKFFNCKGIVIEDIYIPVLQEIKSQLDFLEFIIILSNERKEQHWKGNHKVFDFYELFENSSSNELEEVHIPPGHPLSILFTSGTTGISKGVLNSHDAYLSCGYELVKLLGITSSDRIYVFLPMFHGNPQMMGVMSTLAAGASMILGKKFSAMEFLNEINKYQATIFTYVGSVLSILNKQPVKENENNNSLRLCFGGGAPYRVWENLEKRYQMEIVEAYGQIEAGCVTTINIPGKTKLGSIGKPRSCLEVKVVNDFDESLPPGHTGEIVVRPLKPFSIFSCYDGMPEETLKTFQNLWHHTGDLAWYDENNDFYFAGRKKHIIRHKGENISPLEIEEVLNSHSKILESAVVGIEDDIAEEEIKACIVLKRGEVLTAEEIINFCKDKLPNNMLPRYIEFWDNFEKTPSEKIQIYKLKESGIDKAWDRFFYK